MHGRSLAWRGVQTIPAAAGRCTATGAPAAAVAARVLRPCRAAPVLSTGSSLCWKRGWGCRGWERTARFGLGSSGSLRRPSAARDAASGSSLLGAAIRTVRFRTTPMQADLAEPRRECTQRPAGCHPAICGSPHSLLSAMAALLAHAQALGPAVQSGAFAPRRASAWMLFLDRDAGFRRSQGRSSAAARHPEHSLAGLITSCPPPPCLDCRARVPRVPQCGCRR